MISVRVYDLPTRVFHWCFAALFIFAFAIANLVDDDSSRFSWHMLAGLLLVVTVLFRLLWGLFGTRHARFSDLTLSPHALAGYLRGVVSGNARLWVGHNPASSWAALSMMAIALGLGASGIAMALGVAPDWVEEAHEVVANAFLALVLLHVAGLVAHALRHHDGLPLSMLSGHKRELPAGTPDVISGGAIAVLMLALLAGTAGLLLRGYSQSDRTLHLFGAQLQLGENEHGSRRTGESHERHGGRDDQQTSEID